MKQFIKTFLHNMLLLSVTLIIVVGGAFALFIPLYWSAQISAWLLLLYIPIVAALITIGEGS